MFILKFILGGKSQKPFDILNVYLTSSTPYYWLFGTLGLFAKMTYLQPYKNNLTPIYTNFYKIHDRTSCFRRKSTYIKPGTRGQNLVPSLLFYVASAIKDIIIILKKSHGFPIIKNFLVSVNPQQRDLFIFAVVLYLLFTDFVCNFS